MEESEALEINLKKVNVLLIKQYTNTKKFAKITLRKANSLFGRLNTRLMIVKQ